MNDTLADDGAPTTSLEQRLLVIRLAVIALAVLLGVTIATLCKVTAATRHPEAHDIKIGSRTEPPMGEVE